MTVQPLADTLERPGTMTAPERRSDEAPLFDARPQLLRRVAHDIASPTGVTMTVLEEIAGESKRPELVAIARRGLRRLLRLSEQLAVAADLEGGDLLPDTTLEDARAIAKDALHQAIAIDGRRDVITSCDLAEAKLAVEVDRRLVTSVLREVIGNALRIASSRVTVEVDRAEGRARVRVSDDGPGFSSEALAALEAHAPPRSSVRGLGLSLTIAQEVLAAHGGELRVEASALPPGRRGVVGAAVIVTLPLV